MTKTNMEQAQFLTPRKGVYFEVKPIVVKLRYKNMKYNNSRDISQYGIRKEVIESPCYTLPRVERLDLCTSRELVRRYVGK